MVALVAAVVALLLLGVQAGAGGRVVSAFSVRCMRSWQPFWCGVPGSMHAGEMPGRTHHADN
jgi:hypothetical protein